MPNSLSNQSPALSLHLDAEEIRSELALDPADSVDQQPDPQLEQRAQHYVDRLMDLDAHDSGSRQQGKAAIEAMGRELQGQAAHRSRMLKQAVAILSGHGGDDSPVTNALIDLKVKIEELDPNRVDFSPGWFSKLTGAIPGVGSAIQRYFSRFESAQTVLGTIIASLERSRDQLRRDNLTLQEDQKAMGALTAKLDRQIRLGRLIDDKLQNRLASAPDADDARARFLQEELLFPLRQRIIDLQQQLAVNQQGVLATALVIRNNDELIRGINRALDVTLSALNVAVATALALANQRIVLDKVSAVNRTTSDLIAGTAKKLKTQAGEIQTQASSAMIDASALKSAFADINGVLDEIERFRHAALPQMANTIIELDRMSADAAKRMERLRGAEQQGRELQLEP